ncbi:toll/interleukin-1 receptor domain-containing protein [Clostridium estertheticum]|uniref:toll/interleukin-1 receptor domain-containing protein n=1 Tax=Clostridium estertheticum TaxID=238834 RepID=UPI001C0B9C94|nr:toll/interleukin-1 receptor domain-containing protein [Clostridium estertheticum]MBU3217534.1 toll/interleukin-1 receptor domain-containing protein [Clostridium estertheticum]WAG55234.1 toll/interleukin-1 receptor domain-containing protein [Clostridium estertheticum]
MREVNMFVSYCQKDAVYAENIDLYFKDKNIVIHRDIRDISPFKSIREYMQTIRDMDYAILIITDNYLKSFNCMYEVLEVMKERNYEHKIFPVIVETSIYSDSKIISYIKYWEVKYKEFKNEFTQIDIVNAGNLIENLKRTQNICSSMGEFLSKVADMNNSNITEVNVAIENKLIEQGLLNEKVTTNNTMKENRDVFASLNIPRVNTNSEPTDLEKNKFMTTSFENINKVLKELCNQVEIENSNIKIEIEPVDNRTIIYEFYRSGQQITALKLFLGNGLSGRDKTIGLSCDKYSFGSNNSFNGIISSKVQDGELVLYFTMGFSLSKMATSIEEVVSEIWKNYIQPYLSR